MVTDMITIPRSELQQALDALESISRYGLDTLSGRIDGPDDRNWQRAAVVEMTNRAMRGHDALRARLAQPEPQELTDKEKIVYDILCSDEAPPKGHYWEGFAAAKIVKALAQPEPSVEPVAWAWYVNNGGGYSSCGVGFEKTDIPFAKHVPLYTAPPQQIWQGLTDDEILELKRKAAESPINAIMDAEAKLREKNT